jgi:hypothetical protein
MKETIRSEIVNAETKTQDTYKPKAPRGVKTKMVLTFGGVVWLSGVLHLKNQIESDCLD